MIRTALRRGILGARRKPANATPRSRSSNEFRVSSNLLDALHTYNNCSSIRLHRHAHSEALDDRFLTSSPFPDAILSKKPHLDVSAPVKLRVESLLKSPLHPGDLQSGEIFHLIKQCSRLATPQGMTWAEQIVERLVLEKKRLATKATELTESSSSISSSSSSTPRYAITIKVWELLLFGWTQIAKRNPKYQPMATQRQRTILARVLDEATWDEEHLQDNTSSKPTVDIFNTYLHGLALSGSAWDATELVLETMNQLHVQRGWHCRPNTKSFSQAIQACTNCHHSASGNMALTLLRAMQERHAQEKEWYYQQYGTPYNTQDAKLNKRKIVTADVIAYTTTMMAMIRSCQKKNSKQINATLQQAVDLLLEMMDCTDGTVQVDSTAFLMAMHALAKMASHKKASTKNRVEAARKCQDVLRIRMEYAARQQGQAENNNASDHSSRDWNDPAKILAAYNVCLDAWSKTQSPQAVGECERIYQSMMEPECLARPNAISLNSCLYAWMKSEEPIAPDRAHDLIRLQQELVASGLLAAEARPDFQSYALLILTVAHSASVEDASERVLKARAILEEMVQGVKGGTVLASRSAAAPFAAVLAAAAHSINRKTTDVENQDPFSGDSNAPDSNIYSLALQTYQEAKQDTFNLGVQCDHHLFGAMLRCVIQHCVKTSMERVSMSHTILSDAQEAGQVSRLVVHALLDALGEERAWAALQGQARLPNLWTRSVPPEFLFYGKAKQKTNKMTGK